MKKKPINAEVTPDNFQEIWWKFTDDLPKIIREKGKAEKDFKDIFLWRRQSLEREINSLMHSWKQSKAQFPLERWRTVIGALRADAVIEGLIAKGKPWAAVSAAMKDAEIFHPDVSNGVIKWKIDEKTRRALLSDVGTKEAEEIAPNGEIDLLAGIGEKARATIERNLRNRNAESAKRTIYGNPSPTQIKSIFDMHFTGNTSRGDARTATLRDLKEQSLNTTMRSVIRYTGGTQRGRPSRDK